MALEGFECQPEALRQMPTYEYACKSCGEHLEVVQSFRDDPLTECPNCKGTLKKVFQPVGIAFKGTGFYRNDARSKSGSTTGSSTSSTSTSTSSDSGASTSSTSTTTSTDSSSGSGSGSSAASTEAKSA